jgi:hypothetical protein
MSYYDASERYRRDGLNPDVSLSVVWYILPGDWPARSADVVDVTGPSLEG